MQHGVGECSGRGRRGRDDPRLKFTAALKADLPLRLLSLLPPCPSLPSDGTAPSMPLSSSKELLPVSSSVLLPPGLQSCCPLCHALPSSTQLTPLPSSWVSSPFLQEALPDPVRPEHGTHLSQPCSHFIVCLQRRLPALPRTMLTDRCPAAGTELVWTRSVMNMTEIT